jgi:hypothetical protein
MEDFRNVSSRFSKITLRSGVIRIRTSFARTKFACGAHAFSSLFFFLFLFRPPSMTLSLSRLWGLGHRVFTSA